ncbi:unnamed protein product [Clonostachys chloroleuca]|uniref:Zn(2)-C6 fungal-type domain-containing protein n=1 Tax=Clonostachys chloroleuca TaxID=1926264 RepID=A0AA35MAV5_9HYPO|nr:unnamed protein product [Clonostachys chloroleuca]
MESSSPTQMGLPKANPRRIHRKSRNGCVQCKRRKIKCDESKPECGKCISFRIPCSFSPSPSASASGGACSSDISHGSHAERGKTSHKIRGRPRKDWSAIESSPQQESSSPASTSSSIDNNPSLLNLDQAELLHHFTTTTGLSLANPDDRDDPITRFWSHNAPLVGCGSPAVLHLCLALAARHLLYLGTGLHHQNRSHYVSLADEHFEAGLTKVNEALRSVSPATSGATYLSTILLCYCTFARGPSGPKDFLVCDLSKSTPMRWISIAKGTAVLRETFGADTLFTGLMSPFNSPYGTSPEEDPRPSCVCQNFPKIEWSAPLRELRHWIISCESDDCEVLLASLQVLENIYEATFGDNQGGFQCPPRFKMVFIWLYVMQDSFLSCLNKADNNLALLLVGYYAPLLKTMRKVWYIHSWAEHITAALKSEVKGDHLKLVEWPATAIRLLEVPSCAKNTRLHY